MSDSTSGRAPSPDGDPPAQAPIFVVGSMRSGSTMLRLILDSHENIAIGAETGFMGALAANKNIPHWMHGKGWYRRLGWAEEEFDERLREFYAGLFERYAAAQGKKRWGDKTPFHTGHVAEMARVFPEAVFVGIVRHPGAVASSMGKGAFHYGFPDAVAHWSSANLDLVRQARELGSRFVLCRYEDLVIEGEPVLRELISWLGEPWSPSLLEHHRVQREKGSPRVVDGQTSTRDPIDRRRADAWAKTTTADDCSTLEGVRELAGFFGYESTEPEPQVVRTAHGAASWLADGDDLRERARRWPTVDFDVEPQGSPVIEADPEELAAQLVRVQKALARTRSRRAVRWADAVRRAQRGRSLNDLRTAWATVRNRRPGT